MVVADQKVSELEKSRERAIFTRWAAGHALLNDLVSTSGWERTERQQSPSPPGRRRQKRTKRKQQLTCHRLAPQEALEILAVIDGVVDAEHPARRHERGAERAWMLQFIARGRS